MKKTALIIVLCLSLSACATAQEPWQAILDGAVPEVAPGPCGPALVWRKDLVQGPVLIEGQVTVRGACQDSKSTGD